MEKAFQTFLKKMLSEKYPNVLDVHVVKLIPYVDGNDWYNVYLIIYEKDWDEYVRKGEIKQYVVNLSKYMGLRIADILVEYVEDEW